MQRSATAMHFASPPLSAFHRDLSIAQPAVRRSTGKPAFPPVSTHFLVSLSLLLLSGFQSITQAGRARRAVNGLPAPKTVLAVPRW